MQRNYSIYFQETVKQGFGLTKTVTHVVGFPTLQSLVDSFSLGGSTHELRKRDRTGHSEGFIMFSNIEIEFILRLVKNRTTEQHLQHSRRLIRDKGLYKLWKKKMCNELIAAQKATKLLGVKTDRPNWKQIWQKQNQGKP